MKIPSDNTKEYDSHIFINSNNFLLEAASAGDLNTVSEILSSGRLEYTQEDVYFAFETSLHPDSVT